MGKGEKELLLKDLSARLPYGVKFKSENAERVYFIDTSDNEIYINGTNIEDVKPYLFPLSSMTEEQKQELNSLLPIGVSLQINSNNFTYFEINTDIVCCFHIEFWDKFFDWLNKNHFDYRGLIPKGLALDATNLNIY